MKYVVGIMSGTSLDGVDAALIKINGSFDKTKVELVEFVTIDIPKKIEVEIKDALSLDKSSSQLICSLNFKLGYLFADAVKEVCKKAKLPLEKLDFIGSHGQTIWHQAEESNQFIKSTLQIGDPSVIAYETKTKVVSNFRTMDMAAGGQGAPLVPYVDYILYKSNDKNRILQNIGGIANSTYVGKDSSLEDIVAFDNGPGNMMINRVCEKLFNIPYDKDGILADSGKIIDALLDELKEHNYLKIQPPKSTGRETFGQQYVDLLLEKYKNEKNESIVTTFTYFTAYSIYQSYVDFIPNFDKVDEVILAGGGSNNITLVTMLKKLAGSSTKILTFDELGEISDAKEAVAFAVLANETVNRNSSNAIKATGASEYVIQGNITIY